MVEVAAASRTLRLLSVSSSLPAQAFLTHQGPDGESPRASCRRQVKNRLRARATAGRTTHSAPVPRGMATKADAAPPGVVPAEDRGPAWHQPPEQGPSSADSAGLGLVPGQRLPAHQQWKWNGDTLEGGDHTSPRTHGPGLKTLVLMGAQVLARAGAWSSSLTIRWRRPGSCAGDVAAWNALAYHAWLLRPRPPRISRNGNVKKSLPNHPYSRAKIQEETGVSERTQIRHLEIPQPGTKWKVTPKLANYATHGGIKEQTTPLLSTEAAGEQLYVEPGEERLGTGKGVLQGASRVSAPCA